jgi:CheY-like chemotaxis protein
MVQHHERILVVEDETDVREALAIFFETEGYDVLQAANGKEALALLGASPTVCLILLDLFMPVMDGWAFRRAQLADARLAAIPVIVISADRLAVEKAKDLGARGCHLKPIDFDRLRTDVDAHC